MKTLQTSFARSTVQAGGGVREIARGSLGRVGGGGSPRVLYADSGVWLAVM